MQVTKRQQEIIDTAIIIIAEQGLEGLTTKNIANKIGISEAALYRHFDSKNGILLGILDFFEMKAKALLHEVDQHPGNALQKIAFLLDKRCREFMETPSMIVLILSEELFPQDSRLAEKVMEIMNLNRDRMLALITSGQESGIIRTDITKQHLFLIIMGPFRLLVTRWRLSNFTVPLLEKFKGFWETALKLIALN